MPAGFQVYNEQGILQIDSSQICLSLTKSGYITHETPDGGPYAIRYGDKQIAISVAGENPIVFFGVSGCGTLLRRIARANGWWTFFYDVATWSGPLNIPYYVFDSVVPWAGGVGIETFDESGRLTFSSAMIPMRVLYVETVPPPVFANGLFHGYRGSNPFFSYFRRELAWGRYAGNISFPRVGFNAAQTEQTTVDDVGEMFGVTSDSFTCNFGYIARSSWGGAHQHGTFVYCRIPPTVTLIDTNGLPIPYR